MGATSEEQAFAVADDETKLFFHRLRSQGAASVGAAGLGSSRGAPLVSAGGGLHLFLCDGILCDGFIWKYLWN
ncbi:MAG TPA: hypothetical protein VNO21_27990, partial [Polyangiaceae bacterium]|nr:hypothetical protein [Polyangiaceae bacterium]